MSEKTFEFIYITDSHWYHRTPPSRTDDYLETGLGKIDAVIRYANEHDIHKIIHGGDVFGYGMASAKHLPWAAWTRIAERIQEHSHIDWHFNVGQHDMSAHAHDSIDMMPLGALRMLPNVDLLPNNLRTNIGHAGSTPVMIVGRWYSFHEAQAPEFYSLAPEFRQYPDEVLILTAHGLLVDKPFFGKYVLLEDVVSPSEADVFLGSDYHPGWKTKVGIEDRRGKPKDWNGRQTLYMAPGSLMRHEKPGGKRMPKLTHITVQEGGTISWKTSGVTEDFPFKAEAKAVAREHVVEDDEAYAGIVEKIAEEAGGIRFVDPVDYITHIAAETGVSDAVRTSTLGYIERAQKDTE